MIVCKDGQYFVRDVSTLQGMKVKLDETSEVRLQKNMIIDIARVIRFKLDLLTHGTRPTVRPSKDFYVLRSSDVQYSLCNDRIGEQPLLKASLFRLNIQADPAQVKDSFELEGSSFGTQFSIGTLQDSTVQLNLNQVS